MSTNTGGGTYASFDNAPQAVDDNYCITEDSGFVIFDVMSNDLGGKAKTLWSIDDSTRDNDGSTDGVPDLIVKDIVGVCEKSAAGADIWMRSDGTIGYNASIWNHLAEGVKATDTFTYCIRLSNGTLSWATVTVTITGSNDAPTVSGPVTTNFTEDDSTQTVHLLANAHDVDDGANLDVTGLGYSVTGGTWSDNVVYAFDPATGELTIEPSQFNALAEGETVELTFTYDVIDEHGASVSTTAVVTVGGVNDAPTANDDSASGDENEVLTIDVLANDTDPDRNAVLSLDSVNVAPGNGAVSIVGGQLQFDPGTDFDHLGVGDSVDVVVSYTMSDEHGASSSASVTIHVTGSNDAPTVTGPVTGSFNEDDAVQSIAFLANAQDVDDGDDLDVSGVGYTVTDGTWSDPVAYAVDPETGQITIDPAQFNALADGESVELTFSYSVDDSHGGSVATTAVITVTGSNDGPTANDDSASGDENEVLTIDVLSNDTDPDRGSTLSLVSVSNLGGLGIASVVANQLQFAPGSAFDYLAPGESADVVLNYTMQDEHGAQSSASLTIHVVGSNDAPILTGDLSANLDEGATYVLTGADLGYSDPDDVPSGITFSVSDLSNGVVLVNGVAAASFTAAQLAAGQVSFHHDGSDTLSAGFNVSVEDGNEDGSAPDSGQFVFTVNPIADGYVSPTEYTGADPNDFDNLGLPGDNNLSNAGSNGNDVLYGGPGSDTINGGGGDDLIYGGSGDDSLNGNADADTLYGGSGRDTILGSNGADRIVGGYGFDTLSGNNGADVFIYLDARDTGDLITDFSHTQGDRIDLTALHVNGGFLGALSSPGQVGAHEYGYYYDSVSNRTTIYVDTDGVAGADMEIHLTGNVSLVTGDFLI